MGPGLRTSGEGADRAEMRYDWDVGARALARKYRSACSDSMVSLVFLFLAEQHSSHLISSHPFLPSGTLFGSGDGAGHRTIEGSSCGSDLLRAARGEATISLLGHGTARLWDTAAPNAILSAAGGKVTDYFGEDLVYDATRTSAHELGVVASAPGAEGEHKKLASAIRADGTCLSIMEKYGLRNDGVAQCVDVVRDLRGHPLPAQYFADKLGVEDITSYTCLEEETFRGLMSNACRVHLYPGDITAYYKRIVFEHLDHAREKLKSAPYKLKTDAKSYKVVTSFLSSEACRAVTEVAGVRIPRLLDRQLEPNWQNPIESKFIFMLEDFSPKDGWYQRWLLRESDECEATLSTFARIHAFFWTGSSFWDDEDAGAELEDAIWKSGSYVQPKRNLNHCQRVARRWATERMRCEKELSSFDYWGNLGERLESVAEEAGRHAHPFADEDWSESYRKFRTFTHGDPKQVRTKILATQSRNFLKFQSLFLLNPALFDVVVPTTFP